MTTTIRAVVENGQLRPLEPLDIEEGRHVRLEVLDLGAPTDPARLRAALEALRESAKEYSEEFRDEFQRDIRENRLNFPERPGLFDDEDVPSDSSRLR